VSLPTRLAGQIAKPQMALRSVSDDIRRHRLGNVVAPRYAGCGSRDGTVSERFSSRSLMVASFCRWMVFCYVCVSLGDSVCMDGRN
jgi:hypothetical protein